MRTSTTSASGTGWQSILLIAGCLAFSAAVLYGAVWLVAFLEDHATTTVTEYQSEDWRPDISKCPKDVELWDCINGALYARREP